MQNKSVSNAFSFFLVLALPTQHMASIILSTGRPVYAYYTVRGCLKSLTRVFSSLSPKVFSPCVRRKNLVPHPRFRAFATTTAR